MKDLSMISDSSQSTPLYSLPPLFDNDLFSPSCHDKYDCFFKDTQEDSSTQTNEELIEITNSTTSNVNNVPNRSAIKRVYFENELLGLSFEKVFE